MINDIFLNVFLFVCFHEIEKYKMSRLILNKMIGNAVSLFFLYESFHKISFIGF